jgi:hypothetical protein
MNSAVLRNSPVFEALIIITARPVAIIGDENAGCAPADSRKGSCGMWKRRRFTQTATLKDRLISFAKEAREKALDPAGRARAFVCSYCDFDPVWGSLLDNLHVEPQARGQGIGELPFRSVVSQLSERKSRLGLHLWVFEANVAGPRFLQAARGLRGRQGRL